MSAAPRPFVHLNLAIDSDGEAASGGPVRKMISCGADWQRVHLLREQYDGIAVGAKTWLMDQPKLTARAEWLGREPLRQPARIIFAGHQDCRPVPDGRLTLVVAQQPPEELSVRFIQADGRFLAGPLAEIHCHGIRSLLLEGGPTLARSFLSQECVDVITLYTRLGPEQSWEMARRFLPELNEPRGIQPLGEGWLLEFSIVARRKPGPALSRYA
jgi:riboflavin biosynthesis pyrimidine reductase